MASPTIERHRSIANGSDGDVRLATETIAEIMKYREALFRAAPSHQGGHSDTGAAIEVADNGEPTYEYQRIWITAELPVPEAVEIEAESVSQ